jgi:hypothetical protein
LITEILLAFNIATVIPPGNHINIGRVVVVVVVVVDAFVIIIPTIVVFVVVVVVVDVVAVPWIAHTPQFLTIQSAIECAIVSIEKRHFWMHRDSRAIEWIRQ